MSLLHTLQHLDYHNKDIALVSTTAKNHGESRLLPSHILQGKETINLMLHDEDLAASVFQILDQHVKIILIDVERKQPIDLWTCAERYVKQAALLPYKPNDMTREAAFHLIGQHFNYQLKDKRVLIYGSGNLAFKSALYLAEHNAAVSLLGRNMQKIDLLKQALNAIVPAHSPHPIESYSDTSLPFDVLISAVSAEQVVDETYLKHLKDGALVVDMGISNITPSFIQEALKRSIHLFRLDVRIASPYLEAMLAVYQASFLTIHAGKALRQGVTCVSGGVIGGQGDIIVDSIACPKRIIGIANGTGGLKKHEEYTPTDIQSMETLTASLSSH